MPQVGEKTYTLEEFQAIQKMLMGGEKANHVPPHGSNSLLNTPGYRPDMYSAAPAMETFATVLPLFPSEYENEQIEIFTGETANEGTNPTSWCDNPMKPGFLKTCKQSSSFGDIYAETKAIEFMTSVLRKNRADMDRTLINDTFVTHKFMPDIVNETNINTPAGKEMRELGDALNISFAQCNVRGSTANEGGAALPFLKKEWNGLDQLIKTGYEDVDASVACPAADSFVSDYGNGTLDGDFYAHMADLMRTVRMQGESLFMRGVQYMLVTHPYAIHPLMDTVACNWASTRCNATDLTQGRVDIRDTRTLLTALQTNQVIPFEGNDFVPIMGDWGVANSYNAATNVWTSDIYCVPISWNGRALTYMEFAQLTNERARSITSRSLNLDVTNGGMYAVAENLTNSPGCVSWQVMAMMRMIMRTPFLAWRIDDFNFTSNTPATSPIIGDQYHRNGGQYIRS